MYAYLVSDLFQSTLPMRGATGAAVGAQAVRAFQSTLPMRGATGFQLPRGDARVISIHAPHAGSDTSASSSAIPWSYFNPRSPCGERQGFFKDAAKMMKFQSTLSMRGATSQSGHIGPGAPISIHAPHAGSDPPNADWRHDGTDFNPRSPCGERPSVISPPGGTEGFQSTLPMRGATRRLLQPRRRPGNFNPRSPCGERLLGIELADKLADISIHAPHAGSDYCDMDWR